MEKYNPHKYNNIVKCAVCGQPVGEDDYGNSDICKHCGWQNSKHNEIDDKRGFSYPMLVPLSRAREQYKNGLPFKATFEDFINGLFFYSEMVFDYEYVHYEVFLQGNQLEGKYKIIFCCEEFQQEYLTKEDFYNKANIDGRLLKDIWDGVKNPGFMTCG